MNIEKEREFWCNPTNHLIHAFFPNFARMPSRLAREVMGLAGSVLAIAMVPLLVVAVGAFVRDGSGELSASALRAIGVGLLLSVWGRLTIIACSSNAFRPRWLLPTLMLSIVPPLLAAIYFMVGSSVPIVTGLSVNSLSFLVIPMLIILVPAWIVWSFVILSFFKRLTAAQAS